MGGLLDLKTGVQYVTIPYNMGGNYIMNIDVPYTLVWVDKFKSFHK